MATPENPSPVTCPSCGAAVPAGAGQCPQCGRQLPSSGKNWFKNLTATEIFLLVLGSIMLAIGLVAV